MSVTNLMENIVYNMIDEIILAQKELDKRDLIKDDVAAYILNRIENRYTTSERGVLHSTLDVNNYIQIKTDIFLLFYEAIKMIEKRRDSELEDSNEDKSNAKYNFPHILGQILDKNTLEIVSEINVSLLLDGKLLEMNGGEWKNPYFTNISTKGFYHFWPKYNDKMTNTTDMTLKITIDHANYKNETIEFKVKLKTEHNMGKSFVLPIILLEAK
jgi:competence protein ComFB